MGGHLKIEGCAGFSIPFIFSSFILSPWISFLVKVLNVFHERRVDGEERHKFEELLAQQRFGK